MSIVYRFYLVVDFITQMLQIYFSIMYFSIMVIQGYKQRDNII